MVTRDVPPMSSWSVTLHECFEASTQRQGVRYEHIRSSRPGIHVPSSDSDTVRVGVIGYGYWGPNIVRNVSGLENCQLVAICDQNPAALKRAARLYPGVQLTSDAARF